MDYIRLEVLVRELCNLKNQGKDVVLVSSGAIAQGKKAVHLTPEQLQEHPIAVKQACAAVGQARLMMTYQKIFAEYNQVTAQILMTRQTISNDTNRINAQNTFEELFRMGVIPIVNENDTVATHEIEIGDNDTLSAIVASMIGADLLILLSDIDGLIPMIRGQIRMQNLLKRSSMWTNPSCGWANPPPAAALEPAACQPS